MLTDDAITSTITVLAGALVCLAAAAIVNYVVARRNEHKHPPKGHFVTVDGVRIHYLEQGKGAPVVLVHGNGTMAEDFEISGVLAKLAVTHRVIAFDRPGYGYTDRPRGHTWDATAQGNLMHSALHALGVGSPIVVGHSWGTLVALAMALDHPADIRALVLMSGYYNP